ncbi:High affinity cGMP-specific 3' [Blattella germanica]|nr:High affinity cGMP-specific 3' [Blattella germanica]
MESRVVYFRVQQRQHCEAAEFRTDTPTEEIKGRLVNISAALAPNTPDRCYDLQVVAAGMVQDDLGVDLAALEKRVARLERDIRAGADELPPGIIELRRQVEHFRHKLETTEHLSWLGFHKQLPPPLSTEACLRLQYRRKSEEQKRRVRDKYFAICDVAVSEQVRQELRRPTFDCHQWEDEEILLLLQQMYLDLELTTSFSIELPTLRNFLYEVYKNYNEVPFHNFRHCFCVAQMMYAMVWCVKLRSKIGDLETLILLTSCICHDLDHPGYNNIYQINARTELALRYNDISPLENHHCSVAFRVLELPDCNILGSLPPETFRAVREGVIRCILATDMARHNEILAQFKEITPEFDFSNKAHTNLLTMILIKVADISNEARPMHEFFKQSDAEKLEGLPVTPFMDRDKITKPSSQCSFIGFVLLPLFEALGELFPELQEFIVQPVRDALDYYRKLNEERLHRKSVAEPSDGESTSAVVKSASAHKDEELDILYNDDSGDDLIPELDSTSDNEAYRTDIILVIAIPPEESFQEAEETTSKDIEEEEEEEEHEEDEEETATEVEVSEKTLKFKISTEGSVTTPGGRKSYPGSRKGSREKSDHTPVCEQEKDGAFRDTPDRQFVSSPSPDKHISRSVPVSPGDLCNGVQGKKSTLMARLRTLTDRLAFRHDGDEPGSPTARAMTLPKARRPQRKSPKRGWKVLIGKGQPPSSSLELLSPTESSSPDMRLQNAVPHAKPLSGSLDSVLKKKSSPGPKRGLLARLGRSHTHSEGEAPQHKWMASLAASFRAKKPQKRE